MNSFITQIVKSNKIKYLVLLLLFLPVSQLMAEDIPDVPEPSLEQVLIQDNIAISKWFDSVAEGLDLFLAGKKKSTQVNKSHFKVENSTYVIDGEKPKNVTSFGINVRLPNVEEYWQLKFTSYDEKEDTQSVQKGYLRQTPRKENYGATVGLFRKLGNVKASFQPRIELQDPLKISHSLKFESVADLKTYRVNPKIDFYTDPDTGAGIIWGFNFNFTLNPVFSLTLINEANYSEKSHLYTADNGFSLGESLTKTSSLAYSLIFNSTNRPSYHLEGYSASVAYGQVVYKNILDYQLIPHLDFAKENSFKGVAGVTFNLVLNF
ncbi:MAG: hypothetical protein WA160_07000 [Pseudobdellovibrio sp.]